MLRTEYEKFERSILALLQKTMGQEAEGVPVLLGPEWANTFIDIRNARLLIPGIGFFQYSWESDWRLIESAPGLESTMHSVFY